MKYNLREVDVNRCQPLFLSLYMTQELKVSTQLIGQYFGVEIVDESLTYTLILNQLTKQIKYMLDNDFQGLLNALYRIDVDERKFSLALETGESEDVAKNVGDLILQRIVLKAQTRMKYSNNEDSD